MNINNIQGSHLHWKKLENLEKWEKFFQSRKSQGILKFTRKSGKSQGIFCQSGKNSGKLD